MTQPINISMKEAAYRLGVSRSFLYLENDRGNLPYVQFGKRRLIRVADLMAYQAAHEQAANVADGLFDTVRGERR